MTTPDRDPVTLAREVVARSERLSGFSYSIPPEAQESVSSMRAEQVKAAPDLGRAVINLTAERDAYREENARRREKDARMEALAEDFECMVSGPWEPQDVAARIRVALNGGDHE